MTSHRALSSASRALRSWHVCCVAAMICAGPLQAQRTGGLLSGTVRDEAGRPIENALVALDPKTTRKTERTDSAGRFRFERVSRGQHELTVAWIGFRTDIRVVELTDDVQDLVIVLQRNIALLDTVHIMARRTGVYGTVIAHEEFLPLAGAEVQVIGSGAQAKTGADGRFDFPQVRAGAYVVHVKREKYQARMLSVVVPKDSAIELALTMDAAATTPRRNAPCC